MGKKKEKIKFGTTAGKDLILLERPMVPHKCPVCNGKGFVTRGFYNSASYINTSSNVSEPCRSCVNGIIWG